MQYQEWPCVVTSQLGIYTDILISIYTHRSSKKSDILERTASSNELAILRFDGKKIPKD